MREQPSTLQNRRLFLRWMLLLRGGVSFMVVCGYQKVIPAQFRRSKIDDDLGAGGAAGGAAAVEGVATRQTPRSEAKEQL